MDATTSATAAFNQFYEATAQILDFSNWLLNQKQNLAPTRFKSMLKEQGMTTTAANQYIKVALAFDGMDIDEVKKLGIKDLFSYAAKRYTEMVKGLKDIAQMTQLEVAKLAKQFRKEQQKTKKLSPLVKCDRTGRPYGEFPKSPDIAPAKKVEAIAAEFGQLPLTVLNTAIMRFVPQGEWYKTQGELQDYMEVQANESSEVARIEARITELKEIIEKLESKQLSTMVLNQSKTEKAELEAKLASMRVMV